MEILLARDMGFCFGVRRAVEMMEEATHERGEMVSLGSVVHNPQVVSQLKAKGLDVIGTLEEVDQRRPVAITAHGVSESVVQELERKGVPVVDTTCPIVTRSQQWAKRLADDGYAVIVFGDKNHKETRGVLGWAEGSAYAVPSDRGARRPSGRPSGAHRRALADDGDGGRTSRSSCARCSRSGWTASVTCASSIRSATRRRASRRRRRSSRTRST